MFYVSLIVIFAIVGVAGMPTRRNEEDGPDVVTSGRISSMVIKGIVIGTRALYSTLLLSPLQYSPTSVLSIGAFVLLHLYRKCLFPTLAAAVPPMDSNPATAPAPSAPAPSPLVFNVARASRHTAYPPSTAGTTTSGSASMHVTPRGQGGGHAMKTKFTSPVAGPRGSSIRKIVTV